MDIESGYIRGMQGAARLARKNAVSCSNLTGEQALILLADSIEESIAASCAKPPEANHEA